MPSPQSGHGIHCGQLILRRISKIGATRCHILRLKCTKFDPLGSLQRSTKPPSCIFRGLLLRGGRREREGSQREWKGGREGEGKGRGG